MVNSFHMLFAIYVWFKFTIVFTIYPTVGQPLILNHLSNLSNRVMKCDISKNWIFSTTYILMFVKLFRYIDICVLYCAKGVVRRETRFLSYSCLDFASIIKACHVFFLFREIDWNKIEAFAVKRSLAMMRGASLRIV